MITKVRTRYFKQFAEQEFDLADHVILAGPNNSGKTTLLQAITVWYLALQKWRERRGPESGSKARQRTGVPLTRQEFTALPLREMNNLWTDTLTGLRNDDLQEGQKPGQPRVLTIEVEGSTPQGGAWRLAFELRYQNTACLCKTVVRTYRSVTSGHPRRLGRPHSAILWDRSRGDEIRPSLSGSPDRAGKGRRHPSEPVARSL